jgi:hypothetical protein
MERALRPTPDRSVGQAERRLAATIATRMGGDAQRLRSPALGRRLERGPTIGREPPIKSCNFSGLCSSLRRGVLPLKDRQVILEDRERPFEGRE